MNLLEDIVLVLAICFMYRTIAFKFPSLGSLTQRRLRKIFHVGVLSFLAAFFVQDFSGSLLKVQHIWNMLLIFDFINFFGNILALIMILMFAAWFCLLMPIVILSFIYCAITGKLNQENEENEDSDK